MIKTQKIIKYLAIGFAIFLILNIISAIMYGIISLGRIFTDSETIIMDDFKVVDINENINNLNIDVNSVNITIKEGNNLKVETNNKYIKINAKNNYLKINEESHNLLNNNNSGELIIYLPSAYLFDEVKIDNGAGKVNIEIIDTKELDLNLGAGKVSINNINVSEETNIEGGAGELTINNSNLKNLDLDMGVGKLTLTSKLTGNNEINAGVGNLDLNLVGTEQDYKIKLNKGLGNATINGEKIKDSTYSGNGINLIDIDGGIGNIEIEIKEHDFN